MTSASVVVAAGCPVWTRADAVRAPGGPVDGSYAALAEWARALVPQQGPLKGAIATVAVQGERVEVLEELADGVVHVELPEQPDSPRGYRGFADARSLGPDARAVASHLVSPGSPGLPSCSAVELIESQRGVARVRTAAGSVEECPSSLLVPLGPPAPVSELVAAALGFRGSPYLWGGMDRSGIDCSGLVHQAARLCGRVLPRDAHHQWRATASALTRAELRAGDLLFFGSDASLAGIDHVAISAGGDDIVHAPEEGRDVVLERMRSSSFERLVAFGRLDESVHGI